MRITARLRNGWKKSGIKRQIWMVLQILLVLAGCGCLWGLHVQSELLPTLDAADRFRGDSEMRFAQLACYLPEGKGKSVEDILRFRETLAGKLSEQSLEASEGGLLTIDTYYGMSTVKAATDSASADMDVVGVGGNFFFFHPYLLRSGNYIGEDDLMDDLVVLDETAAWKLFGGTNLSGLTLTLDGKPFVVAGVIAREDDAASQKAYSNNGGLFLSFSALLRLQDDATITGYELVMPDPISGYAQGVVEETFDVSGGDIVENSSRYTLTKLLSVIKAYGERSMRLNGVIYPYWENAVRRTEDYAALFLLLAALFLFSPAMCALVLLILGTRGLYRLSKRKIPEKLDAAVEHRREKRFEKKNKHIGGEGVADGKAEPAEREKGL